MLQEFQEQHPDVAVTILRSCVVLGPWANNYVAKAISRPWLLGVWDHNPPMQFVYEDDLARILTIVVQRRLAGVFNVAGDGVVFYREMAEMMRSRLVMLPSFLGLPLVQLTWKLRIQTDSPGAGTVPGQIPHIAQHRETARSYRLPLLAHFTGNSDGFHQRQPRGEG